MFCNVEFLTLLLVFFLGQTISQTCPDGWYQETFSKNKCVKFVNEIQPWFGAKFDCASLANNASFLSIDNAIENSEIYQVGQAGDTRCNQFYIGLFRSGNAWAWVDSDASNYTNWKAGYPSTNETQNCVTFQRSSGAWYNEDCDKAQCYICQQYI